MRAPLEWLYAYANAGLSAIPIGPFHTIVPAVSKNCEKNPTLVGPISSIDQPCGTSVAP